MERSNEKFCYVLQYYYDKGKNAAQACEKICAVYGEVTKKSNKIVEKVHQDKHISSVDIGMELGIDHKSVLNHLHKVGYKQKLDLWVPHELSAENIYDALLKRNEIEPFLKCVITGDEIWITYDNRKRHRS
ncbi:histone-lysine N-methyltransferase SETMAR-like [Megalopta genalis]|uniref:histone-lysine N-methyltransferase SETMAR-like n=1 Tax=Megalopta genalis TaxID=115081 RepID=UPI003FD2B301